LTFACGLLILFGVVNLFKERYLAMAKSVKDQMEEYEKYIDDKIKNPNKSQPFLRHNLWVVECYQKCGNLYGEAQKENPTSFRNLNEAVDWLYAQMTKLDIFIENSKKSVGCVQNAYKDFPDAC
jgi:hypothetical protein